MQMYFFHISLQEKTQEAAETELTHAQSNDCAIQVDSWKKTQTVFVFTCSLHLLFHDPMNSHSRVKEK